MPRSADIYSSRALRLVLLTAVYMCLQFAPGIGVVLGMLGGMLINMGLMVLIIVLFIVECFRGPFTPRWLLVPVVGLGAFGIWYKVAYDHDQTVARMIEAELQNRNSTAPFAFDPGQEDLIYPDTKVLAKYEIPAIYSPTVSKKQSAYFRFGIKPRHGCRNTSTQSADAEFLIGEPHAIGGDGPSWCLTRVSAEPTLPRITIATRSLPTETIAGLNVRLTSVSANYNDTPVAQHTDASTRLLPPFPIP